MNLNDIIAHASENTSGDDRVTQLKEHIPAADAAQLESDAVDAFHSAYNDGNYSADDAPAMALLADITDAARAVAAEAQQTFNSKDRVAELAARVGESKQEKGTASHDEEVEGRDSVSVQSGETSVESEASPEAAGGADSGVFRQSASGGEASVRVNRTVSSRDLNAHRNQNMPQGTPSRSYSITASADVPDVPQGKSLTVREMAETARMRMSSMPAGGNGEVRRSIATINRNYDAAHTIDGGSPEQDAAKIDSLADERNLPGGSLLAAAQQQADNLTAAGQTWSTPPGDVWCSPSETDYSLCEPLATRTGMLDLPSFTVRRGGVRYPVWKQFPEQRRPEEHGPGDREVANDQAQGWWPSRNPAQNYPYDAQHVSEGPRHDWHGYAHMNRNQVGANPDLEDPDYFLKNPKKHIQGPCVEFAEERMHSAYLWVEEDILRNHTWPELAERFMEDALVQHAHFMSETYIKWIVAHSDRLDPFWAGASGWGGPDGQDGIVPPGPQSYPLPVSTNNYYPGSALDVSSWTRGGMGSAAEAVLEKIGHLVTWFRNTYRTAHNRSMEGFAPWWFKEFLKIDIQRKLNRDHKPRVTDQEVDQYLRAFGVNLQWVYNYQDMPSTEFAPPYEDVRSQYVMPREGWPNSVDIVLYPAGSWVLAEQNVIRLDGAQYDHDRLRHNKYTSLFMEDSWMLLNRCNRSFVVQLRGLCANGATGSPRDACSSDYIPAQRERIETTKDTSGGSKTSQGSKKANGAQSSS